MPLYDFKCLRCGKEFEGFSKMNDRLNIQCSCGGGTEILCSTVNKDWFRKHINEDFDGTPIEVGSKGQLKELCKKHGVYARCLD